MDQISPHPLSPLFLFLAGLYAAERRPGGDATARALIRAAGETPSRPLPQHAPPPDALAALAVDPHPGAGVIAAALPHVSWTDTGALDNLRPDWAAGMHFCELVGPESAFFDAEISVGLYVQKPQVHYGLRTHPAEETWVLLGGRSLWATNRDAPTPRRTGEVIFHPSMIPHQTLTQDAPLIAAWRWSGDIDFAGYAAVENG